MPTRANPEMLVLARESRDVTQTELARAVGISQAKISKYENGLLDVIHEDLEKIARELRYTTDFFFQTDRVYGLGSSMLFNRKRKTVPVSIQKRIQAHVNISRMQIERLLRGAEIEQTRQFPVIDVDQYDGDVEQIAARVRAQWAVPVGPVRNLTELIESAGGVVLQCDFGTPGVDAAHLWVNGVPPLFFINVRVPGDRYRFTLAHEVGHAVMHTYPTGDIEKQADRFASAFLMPADQIRRQLDSLTIEKAARLKPFWRVSIQALIRRAFQIQAISEDRYRSLYKRVSALGYRKNEPVPIPLEKPQIVPQLVELHRQALGYTTEEIGRLVFTRDPQFFELADMELPPLVVKKTAYSLEEYRRSH